MEGGAQSTILSFCFNFLEMDMVVGRLFDKPYARFDFS